jgi:hypothetical protein
MVGAIASAWLTVIEVVATFPVVSVALNVIILSPNITGIEDVQVAEVVPETVAEPDAPLLVDQVIEEIPRLSVAVPETVTVLLEFTGFLEVTAITGKEVSGLSTVRDVEDTFPELSVAVNVRELLPIFSGILAVQVPL